MWCCYSSSHLIIVLSPIYFFWFLRILFKIKIVKLFLALWQAGPTTIFKPTAKVQQKKLNSQSQNFNRPFRSNNTDSVHNIFVVVVVCFPILQICTFKHTNTIEEELVVHIVFCCSLYSTWSDKDEYSFFRFVSF